MSRIRLFIRGLSYSQTQSGAYALVLGEEDGKRRLPIIIGGFEAQSIAIALEKEVNPPRPLTHDLFKNFSDQFNIQLKEVIIHKLQDGVFFSSLICKHKDEEQVLDARTSDAVALAIRFNCPIYTYEEILETAGVILEEEEKESSSGTKSKKSGGTKKGRSAKKTSPKDLGNESLENLHKLLDQAVESEDYELAAKIRDEIGKRESN